MRPVLVVLLAGLVFNACGGRSSSQNPAASDPSATVTGFLAAIKANDLSEMGKMWGLADRGPASGWNEAETVHKHLFVIQSQLVHDRYEFVPSNEAVPQPNRPVIRVRLIRGRCQSVVPFTLVRYKSGWLVREIDLAAAGNPRRQCP